MLKLQSNWHGITYQKNKKKKEKKIDTESNKLKQYKDSQLNSK